MKKLGVSKKIPFGILMSAFISQNIYADFLKEDQLQIDLRNFYFDRNFSYPQSHDLGSWSQSINAYYQSGYTDTALQLGADISLRYAFRLNDKNENYSDTNFPYDTNKTKLKDSYGKYGATLKLKYQDTNLKVGELYPKNPIVFIDTSRQLPTSYMGVMLDSKEIKDLNISLGRITRINARNDDNYEKLSLLKSGPRYESDGLNFLGFDYNFNESLSGSYWFGQLEDIYQQNYLGLAYTKKFNQSKLKIETSYFYNEENGKNLYGEIDSQAIGLMGTYYKNNNQFSVGVQKNMGNDIFPTLAGYPPQPFLQAWSNLPFYNPEELTWHLNYIYDFKSIGFNGLKSRFSYHYGTDIKRPGLKDNKEEETILGLIYAVPEGKYKGLGLEWRYTQADTRYGSENNPGNNFKENRVITTYEFKF